jgi:hypothetical protein
MPAKHDRSVQGGRVPLCYTETNAVSPKGKAMPTSEVPTSEVAILSRILEADKPGFSSAVARAILALDFNQADRERMRQLSAKAREGGLSRQEQVEINNYERVGHFLNLIQSKARCSLKAGRGTNGRTKAR